MPNIRNRLLDIGIHVVAFIVMIVLAILAFFVTTFVVSTGASLAGHSPSGDFIVLAAALLVAAAILGGRAAPTIDAGSEEEFETGPEVA